MIWPMQLEVVPWVNRANRATSKWLLDCWVDTFFRYKASYPAYIYGEITSMIIS